MAKLLANSGIWIQKIATSSVFFVGLISFAQFAQVAFSPLTGEMADRGGTRAQLIVGRSFCFLGERFSPAGPGPVTTSATCPPGWSRRQPCSSVSGTRSASARLCKH